jgi:hypothetical protein
MDPKAAIKPAPGGKEERKGREGGAFGRRSDGVEGGRGENGRRKEDSKPRIPEPLPGK